MSDRIVCKPTSWFLFRAGAMVLMFGIFAVFFYKDGSTGYREKNFSYYSWQTVQKALAEFSAKKSAMTPEQWREYAESQTMELPEDRSILPAGTPEEVPWPSILADYEKMEAGQSQPEKKLFEPYMEEADLRHSAPDKPYDAGKIFEQWVVFWICLALATVTLFFLLRTLTRKMVLENGTFQPAGGKPVAVADLVRLDLRRWQSKGLAFAWASKEGGPERKIRIDGLTYGGFKKEEGEPAEKLMQGLRSAFSGELIEYETEVEEAPKADAESS